jgi:hypothetical protein
MTKVGMNSSFEPALRRAAAPPAPCGGESALRDLPDAPREAPDMPLWIDEPGYWALVEQLMDLGWYRVGPGQDDELGRKTWGFREGHLLDHPRQSPVWIPAPDEQTAMRIMLAAAYTQGPTRRLRSTQPSRDRPLLGPQVGHRRRNFKNGVPDLGRG